MSGTVKSELERAITLLRALEPGTHVIEASAGTGKTWTITSLIAAALALDAVHASRVLTVTFTRAATAELRVRVRERITSLAQAISDPNTQDVVAQAVLLAVGGDDAALVVRERLARALAEADSIGVDTMHGWCATLLGQYGDLLGLDAPADDTSTALPPVAELTERGALVASAKVPAAQWYGFTRRTVSVNGLEQLAGAALAGIARVLVQREDGTILGDDPADVLRLERDIARLAELHAVLSADWSTHRAQYVQAIQEAMSSKRLSGAQWRAQWLDKRVAALDHVFADLLRLFEASTEQCELMGRFGSSKLAASSKSGADPFTLGEFSDTLDALMALLPSLTDALAMPLRHFIDSAQQSLPHKAADFDDLLRLVADGLARDPAVAERVRRSADLVLIDESQDTDPLQWRIFLSLFSSGAVSKRLVLVGDPKQSIYRFRNAEVAVYLAARDAATGDPFTLGTNYRSDAALVHAVNAVYAGAPGVFGDGVQYEPVTPARLHAELVPLEPAPLRFVEVVPDAARTGVHAVREAVAADVAARIARVLRPSAAAQQLVHGDSVARPVTAKDCAVLVATNRQARQIVRALRAAGVHAVAATRNAVTQSDTAADVYTVLRALDAPDDRALLRAAALTALLRPALGLALTDPPIVILEALDGEAGQHLDDALRTARSRWSTRGIMEAWITLDHLLGVSLHIAEAGDAERRLTDVRHLLELLAAHESRTRSAPAESLRWLAERMQERTTDQLTADELEERLESDDDAVRVLTMHASKGLEFPMVWIPYAWVRPHSRPPTRDKPLVRRYDAACAEVEGVVPIGSGKPSAHPVAQAEQVAQLLEQQRLLYVALTRARNMCTVYVHEDHVHRDASLARLLSAGGNSPLAQAARLAAVNSNGIVLERMQGTSGEIGAEPGTAAPRRRADPVLAAAWTRREPLDSWWRRGSFTSLTTQRAMSITAGPGDADGPLLEGLREPAADEGDDSEPRRLLLARTAETLPRAARVSLAEFPRGRAAGNALHDVLERVVQQRAVPGSSAAVIPDALARQGLDVGTWSTPLAAALESALDIPLVGLDAPAPTLRSLAAHTTFTELTFDFALVSERGRAIRARQLARVFTMHPGGNVPVDYAAQLAALDFVPLRGLLTGAIDLVARHNGAWTVLDYKSNHLGDTIADYALAPMTTAMCAHHYILQYHLYLVALHRFLRLRQPAYHYDTHVLGIGYLFVRGMELAHAGSGVFTDRPPRARIEALDTLLRTGEIA